MSAKHTTPPPAFQFYAKDWLASRRVRLMTAAQRGIYINLLAAQWVDGDLPDTPSQLAKLADVSLIEFNTCWCGPLEAAFRGTPQGIQNERLEAQRKELAAYRKSRQEAGRKGGKSTQAKLKQSSSMGAKAVVKPASASASASSSSSSSAPVTAPAGKEEGASAPRAKARRDGKQEMLLALARATEALGGLSHGPHSRLCKAMEEYRQERADRSMPCWSEKNWLTNLRKAGGPLMKLDLMIEALEAATRCQWKGLFPPKDPKAQERSPSSVVADWLEGPA